MQGQVQEAPMTRTVSVRIPGGETQYWLTDQAFSEGDRLVRNDRAWVVSEVLPPSRSGGYLTIVLREDGRASVTG
jgi:hypothetical protein